MSPLPYVDTRSVRVPVAHDEVWRALETYADRHLAAPDRSVFGRVLGTDPPGGFAVIRRVAGERVELAGRHRFARYRLTLSVEDDDPGTVLSATTHAAFPGLPGRVYQTLVIRTRLHVVATRALILHRIARLAVESAPHPEG